MNNPLHILIADDSTSFGWAIAEKLRVCGHIIHTVERNGCILLEEAAKHPPDVLIMDLHMQDKNAAEVIRDLRQSAVKQPVFVTITSFDYDPLEQEVRELAVDFYLTRPFDLDYLANRLEEYAIPLEEEEKVILFDPIGFRKAISAVPEGPNPAADAEQLACELLMDIKMPSNLNGYHYAKSCIVKAVFAEHGMMLTKELYPAVAREYECSDKSIERSVRHAIDLTWNQCHTAVDAINYYFGDRTSGNLCQKPSNGAFIFRMAEYVRSRLGASSCR